jgi:ABC-type phosphate transport system substrate-binding protein
MKFAIAATALTLLSSFASGQECGPDGSFSIAGSSTVLPIAMLWAEGYSAICTGTEITVESGGSSAGAARVCADETSGTPVEIGDMSRPWKDTEATAAGDGVYNCVVGDTSRSAIQIDVAIDGLSVATQTGGAGNLCIESLGGLTTDQLRWIFSSYGEVALIASGWDVSALANSDGDDTTHLWSELSADCPAVEIMISGPDSESGTYECECHRLLYKTVFCLTRRHEPK